MVNRTPRPRPTSLYAEGTLVARTTHPILPRQPSKNVMIPQVSEQVGEW